MYLVQYYTIIKNTLHCTIAQHTVIILKVVINTVHLHNIMQYSF